jgi:hypothetical protein
LAKETSVSVTGADNLVPAFLENKVVMAREKKRHSAASYGKPTITATVSSKAEHKVEIMVVI